MVAKKLFSHGLIDVLSPPIELWLMSYILCGSKIFQINISKEKCFI